MKRRSSRIGIGRPLTPPASRPSFGGVAAAAPGVFPLTPSASGQLASGGAATAAFGGWPATAVGGCRLPRPHTTPVAAPGP